jgi:bifunctional N-acetylglucosamine-1-phosphate-uridyltransferase/glucosamine-1-phosphate-acetyltransferase GlmU-like protein
VLVIPAAGLGTRLGADRPKLLVPVAGVPMIDRLLDLFAPHVERAVIVVHPSFEEAVKSHLADAVVTVTTVVQRQPTGMLDAILLATPEIRRAKCDQIWITWCDQVAMHPDTIGRLAGAMADHAGAALVMPTVTRPEPYIHLQRDASGRITRVLHRREGDAMPPVGESDMGLFALHYNCYDTLLPGYAEEVSIGAATGERNFLPFIAWVNGAHEVVTFPAIDAMEAVGVNTPEELRVVEAYLATRDSQPR